MDSKTDKIRERLRKKLNEKHKDDLPPFNTIRVSYDLQNTSSQINTPQENFQRLMEKENLENEMVATDIYLVDVQRGIINFNADNQIEMETNRIRYNDPKYSGALLTYKFIWPEHLKTQNERML
jgi:hypothetical protein